jgi:hypothetical protein
VENHVEPVSGWRRTIRDEAERIEEMAGAEPPLRLQDAVREVRGLSEVRVKRTLRNGLFRAWLADRILGREDRRYAAAVAAVHRAREIAVTIAPDQLLIAKVPGLRADVKRYIGPTEPQFEVYLRLLDEMSHADPSTDPASAGGPPVTAAPTGSAVLLPATEPRDSDQS